MLPAQESEEQQRAPNETDEGKPGDGEIQTLRPGLSPNLTERERHFIPGDTARSPGIGVNGLQGLPFRDKRFDFIGEAIRWLRFVWLRRAGQQLIIHLIVPCPAVHLHLPPASPYHFRQKLTIRRQSTGAFQVQSRR